MHKAMVASLEAAMKCDEYDRQPNAKGKVKIRFREANGKKFFISRPYVISAGLYEYNNKNLPEAIKAWKLYIDSAEDPLFTGLDMTKDQYRSEVCYYIGLSSYNIKDYATATKYAKMAAQDSAKHKRLTKSCFSPRKMAQRQRKTRSLTLPPSRICILNIPTRPGISTC